ncbi:DEAD/DEAH box helicase [Aspergillus ellipticus CBS 707.79]|uniref:DEAD/DEAH box helicase n=1 Tax=Aspergillus ellipticus CBS 707.79 TaxID=1448320 RepID=A0A319D366_9EURO|nr:DEAD/DEAH box helicase [Aspergillus ellipticus CBS 707.79]
MGPKKKSDARGGPKPGTKQAKAAAEAQTAKKAQASATEEPKKPSVKEVIGGASWTGKLPVNMLAEHCQKQKWEKPEYTMMKVSGGFVSAVILKRVDMKTKETVVLPPMKLPPSHKELGAQPTALEARHFAAAYALFRVCNMKNLHMMLPPTYKKLWKEDFTEIKAADVKEGKVWMYEADPFLAKQERESAAADLEKKRKEREKAQAKATEQAVDLGLGSGGDNKSKRIWSQAPKVDLGSKVRREIEGILRQHAIWNPYNVEIPNKERNAIVEELTRLGFRRSHAEEATSACKDKEEALEWLLIYVPEDDLPRWCLPEGYSAGVSLASDDLAREAKIKRLSSAGYPADICSRTLDTKKGDELAAAEFLQSTLVHGSIASGDSALSGEEDLWAEEQDTLEAIFGERYSRVSDKVCEIKGEGSSLPESLTFRFQRPSAHYPSAPPVIQIQAKGIPAYIRLSAIRQVVQYSEENFSGEPMIFNILDWLEVNLPGVMENPGKLRDISTVSASPTTTGTITQLPVRQARRRGRDVNWQSGLPQSVSLRESWEAKQSTKAQQEMLRKRQSLPAWNTQEAIIHAVNTHQVTIISGETGSGKSTQSVQFLLDDLIKKDLGAAANIICTQPRRISALGLADRVSDERCSSVGDEVGYIIRGESKAKSGTTKITFVTTGVLLRRMQSGSGSDGNVASSLSDVTHVVVDEVHERSLDTDFLLALLRDVCRYRKDIKVILMSATLDAEIFSNYFGGRQSVGLVNIPGRTFPVEDYYLDDVIRDTGFAPELADGNFEDDAASSYAEESLGRLLRSIGMGINYELIASTVRYIDSQLGDQPGGILIFLPGTMEIDRCLNAIRRIPNAHPLPLHASLLPADQRRVFQTPPKGKRKVIAATNVAETSITIEDVVAVIDTGRVKETSYDPKDNIVRLQEVWASQAACKQRRGRAGRVRAGICYKLYTRKAEMNMMQRPDPEIRRVPLEQLCLSVKSMQGISDVATFLANTITPPESTAVEGALDFLHRVGALDHDRLTALGRYLSMIPADLRCAKLMVYGSLFGCIDACITISSILTVKSPFVSPRERREEANAAKAAFSKGGDGDLLTDLQAYQQWSELVKAHGYWQTQSWCSENFLSHQTLRDISSNKSQFVTSLKDAGLLPVDYSDHSPSSSSWDRNAANRGLLRALIAGAFQPQIAQVSFPDKKFASSVTGTVEIDPDARTIKYFNQENGRIFIHPSSALFSAQGYPSGTAYLSYFTKMATSKVFIRDLTPFNAYSLLLFCGSITLDTTGRGLIVDGWLRLRGWARIGVLVSRLRMMLDEVIAMKIDQPASAGLSSQDGNGERVAIAERVVEVVKRLVELNGLDQ